MPNDPSTPKRASNCFDKIIFTYSSKQFNTHAQMKIIRYALPVADWKEKLTVVDVGVESLDDDTSSNRNPFASVGVGALETTGVPPALKESLGQIYCYKHFCTGASCKDC